MSAPQLPRDLTDAEVKALVAIVSSHERYGRTTNGKVFDVPKLGDVVVQYRTIHNLGDLGLVTWTAHSCETTRYQGRRFGRRGGGRASIDSCVVAVPTPAAYALLRHLGWIA